jgi:diguanylate cyclase (GGDEF)-like protein
MVKSRWRLIARGLTGYAKMRLWLGWARIPIGKRLAMGMLLIITLLLLPYLLLSVYSMQTALAEQQQFTLLQQLKSAQVLLDQECRQLLRTCEDYSVWQECRDALLRRNHEWIKVNILDWAMPHFYLDAILIFDMRGRVLYRRGEPVSRMEGADNPLLQGALRGSSGMGFLQEGRTLYLVAYAPILGEDYAPPQAGVMMFAKRLDEAQLSRLWGQLTRTVRILPIVNPPTPFTLSPLSKGGEERGEGGFREEVWGRESGGELTLGTPLLGIDGTPVAWLTVSTPPTQARAMQHAIHRATLYLVLAGLLITLVTTATTLWMLRRHLMLFLKAVNRLASGMWEARVPYPACDEFGILARAFNLMADQLQSAFEQQEEQRIEIEKQKMELEQLYEQLQQAYQALETANQELVAMNAMLSQAAITDSLTGLRNHRAFQESLMNLVQMAERYGQPLSLIMLDIDYFKQFNDRFGHPAGDELLRQVASLLRQSARAYDVVARYGGEEFAILLPNTDLNEAIRVAERLRQQIAAIQNPYAPITASFGVASYRHGSAPATLLYEADTALYEAKRRGRNRVYAVGRDALPTVS